MRLKYENEEKNAEIVEPGGKYYKDPTAYALATYNYYLCHKCDKPYYGGLRRCGAAGGGGDIDPSELICGSCLPMSAGTDCGKHGLDYIEYKCRFCCSVAVFFCFGTTHFCDECHRDPGRMTGMAASDLPKCPSGPLGKQLKGECPLKVDHPPHGEEYALGCGLCRNEKTF